ncbi:MAG: hypothetical protein L0Z55_08080 [Planctomycetes bacterium]|nr:hypothetical protein [Planctomycetota bacterium]
MNPPRDLIGVVRILNDLLEKLGVSYAFGGAIAQNYWGTVRATQDVDVIVAVPKVRYQTLVDALSDDGFQLDTNSRERTAITVEAVLAQERRRRYFTCYRGLVKVDFFVPLVPLQHAMLQRARKVAFQGAAMPIVSAEDLILIKMVFHREKDLRDVCAILWSQRGNLDQDYLSKQAESTLRGEELRELKDLILKYPGSGKRSDDAG